MAGAARFEGGGGVAEEGLGDEEAGVRPDGRAVVAAAGRQEGDMPEAHFLEEAAELVLDHVGKRADHEEIRGVGLGQGRDHRREAGILALGEGGLDAGAGIAHHPDIRGVFGAEADGGAAQVELDDFRGAGADEEELADVGAAREQAADFAVDLVMGIGEAGEVLLFHDRGAESRLGEDHHPGGGLQQMRAGPRADDEEEGVLHLAVQPDDSRQTAEHLVLAALAQDR